MLSIKALRLKRAIAKKLAKAAQGSPLQNLLPAALIPAWRLHFPACSVSKCVRRASFANGAADTSWGGGRAEGLWNWGPASAAKAAYRGRLGKGVEDAGIYRRWRTASDTAWPAQVAYRKREGLWQRLSQSAGAMLRLVVPVMLLVSALAGTYLYLDTKLPYFADGGIAWLTVGHALVPATFFVVALTNRRYGASYAFAQVALSMVVIVAALAFAADSLRGLIPSHAVPTACRFAMMAFGGAFFVTSFVSIC